MTVTDEITGFVQRELVDLLERFKQRREKLQAAVDAAKEIDSIIPKLEKLIPPNQIQRVGTLRREDNGSPPQATVKSALSPSRNMDSVGRGGRPAKDEDDFPAVEEWPVPAAIPAASRWEGVSHSARVLSLLEDAKGLGIRPAVLARLAHIPSNSVYAHLSSLFGKGRIRRAKGGLYFAPVADRDGERDAVMSGVGLRTGGSLDE